jgi:sulfide:quinone oxidoreductase
MKTKVVVLGAGFGGLELVTALSEGLGEAADVVLIDRAEAFVFGHSKIDLLFRRKSLEEVRTPYRALAKPGVRFVRENVVAFDPERRRVTTDRATHAADFLVVALGAEVDASATPGLAESGDEFYTVAGALRLREKIDRFRRGAAVVGVCSTVYKCPPAPCEAALLLHDDLCARGRREGVRISLVMPFETPLPTSEESSKAILEALSEREIRFVPARCVQAQRPKEREIVLDDGSTMPCDLFLGVPQHRLPQVVVDSGLSSSRTEWVAVEPKTLETRFPGVFALGDVSAVGTPKAGVFAEGAARIVAQIIASRVGRGAAPGPYAGQGSCYLDFGSKRIGRVDVDYFTGPRPKFDYRPPEEKLTAEKTELTETRLRRWFGRVPA